MTDKTDTKRHMTIEMMNIKALIYAYYDYQYNYKA